MPEKDASYDLLPPIMTIYPASKLKGFWHMLRSRTCRSRVLLPRRSSPAEPTAACCTHKASPLGEPAAFHQDLPHPAEALPVLAVTCVSPLSCRACHRYPIHDACMPQLGTRIARRAFTASNRPYPTHLFSEITLYQRRIHTTISQSKMVIRPIKLMTV